MAAAIRLADADGLEGVSLRNVAGALEAGPMRLYGYVATKEELLELMVDSVWGELAAPLKGGWRKVLREIAERVRTANHAHPWFVSLLGGRPQFGPHALAHREAAFAALSASKGFEDIDFVLQAYRTMLSYVVGALQSEDLQVRAEQASGLKDGAWQAAMWPYVQRTIATGRYPMLAKITTEAKHPSPEEVFKRGIELVLDGIATRLP